MTTAKCAARTGIGLLIVLSCLLVLEPVVRPRNEEQFDISVKVLDARAASFLADWFQHLLQLSPKSSLKTYVSIQNEPDITVLYESCSWSLTEMVHFLATHGNLTSHLPIQNGSTFMIRVLAAESFRFNPT